jgi:5-methylthioadenosine/S-adenosylhomocysteine deaminase
MSPTVEEVDKLPSNEVLMKTRSYRLISIMAILAVLIVIAVYAIILIRADSAGNRPILLQGTIVTPNEVISDGWILIQDGRIRLISESKPEMSNAIEINTGGIIFPGLIDLHNHVSFNVFPRWQPERLFSDGYEWRTTPEYISRVRGPYDQLVNNNHFCDMNTYGELRALVGGTTSILATASASCIRGLVRNLDHSSGFYRWPEFDEQHIRNEIEMRAETDPATITSVQSFLAESRSEAFFIHLVQGVDTTSLDEFYFAQSQGVLTDKTAIIHGIALGPAEFSAMHDAGVALVWSPRSNIELYGETANIGAALDAGVQIALAPDWAITGSSNMLDELHYAAAWNTENLSGRLTDQQLVMMITSIPAEIAGIDDKVGTLQTGLYADLLVIFGDRNDPNRALIQAQAGDVQLVFIGGQPIYGAPNFMESFWNISELNEVNVDGVTKMVKMPNSAMSISDLISKLQAALASQGINLAPIH